MGKGAFRDVRVSDLPVLPDQQRWSAEWKLGRNTYTLRARFCTSGADLRAQSALSKKISASELRRKFIKGELSVG